VALSSPTPGSNENLPSTSSNPTWCFSSSFSEPNAYEAFDALFRPTINLPPGVRPPVRQWKAETEPDDEEEDFAFNCRLAQFEPIDTLYNLEDLNNVFSSATLNDLDLDSRLANRQSDFEMVCFPSRVSYITLPAYSKSSSVWHGHYTQSSCRISSMQLLRSLHRAPPPFQPSWASFPL
jgi:hypothetical protein